MPKNIILIDKRVQDYETIVAAIDPNLAVGVVFNYFEDTFDTLKTRIANETNQSSEATNGRSVGLLQHNYNAPMFSMLSSAELAPVAQVVTQDPELARWTQFKDFIVWCKTAPEIGAAHFDMMACALYSNPDWKHVIDTLTAQTGVTVRASADNTGSGALGGNWFLESQSGVNLKGVYFTQAIEKYDGILYLSPISIRKYPTKGIVMGSVQAWGNSNYGGTAPWDVSSYVVAVYSNDRAFASLDTGGAVDTWGETFFYGGSSRVVYGGVVAIYSTQRAFVALKNDGTVVAWGDSDYGGTTPWNLSGVVSIYSNDRVFVALKNDGGIESWGYYYYGGNYTLSGVVAVYSTSRAFAALTTGGGVQVWGDSNYGGATPWTLSSGVVAIYSTQGAFAALKSDGSVVGWGNSNYGGNYTLSGVVAVYSNPQAFAALKSDGGVQAWGNSNYGGTAPSGLTSDVVAIYSTNTAFAALKTGGGIVVWGDSANGGTNPSIDSGVVSVYSNTVAFAALKNTGTIQMWGQQGGGGSTYRDLGDSFVAIYSNDRAFAALKNDGSVVTWGDFNYGGMHSGSSDVVAIYSTGSAFAAIKTTTTTFDLAGSYYSNMDRFNILRKKENRRRANLTTLNNVFTLSTARDIKAINPNIPTSSTLRVIVPDYTASSSYSITSTATIPSDAGSVIIACDEGEPVTISGTTYVNYGSYVYTRETNNTYTKLTSPQTISGTSYTMYGGDGINSSGIAMVVTVIVLTNPTLSALVVATSKTYGEAPFTITAPAPTSASNGAITYSSNATGVATIDPTTGVITLVSAGKVTITATQAATAQYASATITSNELTVSLASASLSAFAVTASKTYGDVPFAITAPAPTSASNGAITYSSNATGIATIDATTGVITLVSAGKVTFTATQAATAQYASATITSNELTVSLASASLSAFAVTASKTYGDVPFAVTAPTPTTASNGAITYSSNATGVATIEPNTGVVTLVSAGKVTFTATQAETAQYASATITSNELTVSLAPASLSAFAVAASKTYGAAPFAITAPAPTSASNGAITYSSNATGIATIDATTGVITLVSAGKVTFTATQTETAQYASDTITSNELTVSLASASLSTFTIPSLKMYGAAPFAVTAPTTASNGAITYSSSNIGIATIDATTGVITLVSAGKVTITATQAETAQYASAMITSNGLTVSLAGQTVAPGTSFAGADLSGASLVGAILAGTSFTGATLTNVDFSGAIITGANFANANIVSATNLPVFSTAQKLQLLRNTNNVAISAIQISTRLSGAEVNAAISLAVPVPNILGATFLVKAPTFNVNNDKVVTIIPQELTSYASIYIPLNDNDTVIVNGVLYTFNGTAVLDSTGATVTSTSVLGVPFQIYAGSIIFLNTSVRDPVLTAFVVPSYKTVIDAAFQISARPISNSSGAITYVSNNSNVATIDVSGNLITIHRTGEVTFTASQAEVPEEYFLAAAVTSNTLRIEALVPAPQMRTSALNTRWFSTNNAPRANSDASDHISALRARTLYRDTVNFAAQGGKKVVVSSGAVYSGPVLMRGKCLGAGVGVGTAGGIGEGVDPSTLSIPNECAAFYIRSAGSYRDLLDVTRGIYAGHSETHTDPASALNLPTEPPVNSHSVRLITPQGAPTVINKLVLNSDSMSETLLSLSPQTHTREVNTNAVYDAALSAAPDPLKCIQYPPNPELSITYGGAGCPI